jgi:hypothetical protein
VTPSPPGPLLSVRAAVVLLLLALVVGLCACGLAYLANHSLPADALVGGGAAGGALMLFHTVIGR